MPADPALDETFGAPYLPAAITAAELQAKSFPPVRWIVPGLIPDGLTILAGRPKSGKSWLALDLAVATGRGGYVLDKLIEPGEALYCALEDSERRLKDRLAKIVTGGDWPSRLVFWTRDVKALDEGGLDQIRQWIASAARPRLIIIDTFAKVRSPRGRDEDAYGGDYRAIGSLKALADETGVAILIVHHVRKMDADDPLDTVSGTLGLTGAADTILVLKRVAEGVTLFARGRDIEELELAMEFQKDSCRWRILGSAAEVRISAERQAIIEALREEGEPMTPVKIATVTGHGRVATRRLLVKMAEAGEITKHGRGKYGLAA